MVGHFVYVGWCLTKTSKNIKIVHIVTNLCCSHPTSQFPPKSICVFLLHLLEMCNWQLLLFWQLLMNPQTSDWPVFWMLSCPLASFPRPLNETESYVLPGELHCISQWIALYFSNNCTVFFSEFYCISQRIALYFSVNCTVLLSALFSVGWCVL